MGLLFGWDKRCSSMYCNSWGILLNKCVIIEDLHDMKP